MDIKVTWDGRGLNDANDPHKERVATFNNKYLTLGAEIAKRINSHEELEQALRDCEEAISCRENTMGDPMRLLEVQDMGRRAARKARELLEGR